MSGAEREASQSAGAGTLHALRWDVVGTSGDRTADASPGGDMLDALLVAVTIGFFALAWLYVRVLERM